MTRSPDAYLEKSDDPILAASQDAAIELEEPSTKTEEALTLSRKPETLEQAVEGEMDAINRLANFMIARSRQ